MSAKVVAALLLCVASAQAKVAAVWAATDGDKIDRDDISNPRKQRNAVWDGRQIRLAGARNEIVAFQVIVESDGGGIARLSASLPELKNGAARIAYTAPGADPTNTVDRAIQLFSVNYMLVKQPTQAPWIFHPGSPDAPGNARPGRGGFPLSVEPNRSQAIWIEIYTGRDKRAGDYHGSVAIRADGTAVEVPVTLTLFDFYLPDRNSMNAMMYYQSDQPELYQGRNLDAEYHRFAHRHRIELVDAYDEESLARHFGRFDGSDFTKERGYEGPGENTGNRIAPRTFYGPDGLRAKEAAWPKADSWMRFLAGRLPSVITFFYLPDEPYPKQYPEVRELASMMHGNPGPGGKLRTFLTHEYVPELDGAADIWCVPPAGYNIERAEKERARGRGYWTYNGGRPAAGAIVIDAPATDARATIWGAFKHSIDVYFYWHSVHWRHNAQKVGNRVQNVWANPVTFDNRGQPNKPLEDQSFANGDGVLMYPGTDKLHPAEDRGIAGPIGTVQLANFRRGLQDHQYLTLAKQCGAADIVEKALRETVPRMFSQAGKEVGFSESADDYERNRIALGRAIEGCRSGRKHSP